MQQRAAIMQGASGIDYAQYTTGALAFDYERLFADTGHDVASAARVQRRTGVGETPLVELHNITALARTVGDSSSKARRSGSTDCAWYGSRFPSARAAC